MKATLAQANQVLNLISQKDLPSDRLQALFASGLLSDLLDANAGQVDREKFRELLGLALLVPTFAIQVNDTSDCQPPYEDWEVRKDAKSPVGTLELELAEFLEKSEPSVNGEEMLKRAAKHGFMLGLRHAKALLAVQDRIPKEWRKYFLVFPGTVCRGAGDRRHVPCLGWRDGRWCLSWYWLGCDRGGGGRLVVCK